MQALARWLQQRMVFLIGTTESEIKAAYLQRPQEEINVFDKWIKKNGGTLEYGLSNDSDLFCLEELEGPVDDDWEVGLPTAQPANQSQAQSQTTSELLDMLQQNDDIDE